MRVSLLPIILLLIGTSWCQPYSPAHTLQCSSIDENWTYEQNLAYLWNILQIHTIDRYAFLTLCPIIVLLQLLLIITMIKFKVFIHSPEDVIFSLIIIQCVCSISLFIGALYDTIFSTFDEMPDSFPSFCLATGIVNNFGDIMEHVYLFYFLVHVIFNANKSIKESKWFKGAFKHILPFIICIPFVVLAYAINWMGLSQLGICQPTSTRGGSLELEFPIFQMAFSFGFVGFSIYTYKYFKTHMPHVSALNRRNYQQNMLITRFTIGMSIIESLYSIARFSLYLNCRRQNPIPDILIFATIFNLTRLAEFMYLIVVTFLYKKIGNKIKKFFRGCFSKGKSNQREFQMSRITKMDINGLDLSLQQRMLDVMEENNEIDFLKITQIMTMLTGLRTAYRQYLVTDERPKAIKNLHYQQQISFRVNSKWLYQYEQEALLLPRLSFLDGKFTIYSPQIFKHLLSQDNISGIDQSFDLIKNSQKLYKIMSSNGGGRSGQFFFFSEDNKYILKTVPKQEFIGLLQELQQFYNHFTKYPQTLITKFYGMFKIQHSEIYRVYYILVMKNISGCSKLQIKSIYDMKGSTDDRKVLKDTQILEPASLSPTTVYKDLDFIRIEHKLFVSSFDTNDFKNQLKLDTAFLQGLNIIDYSLLVMKVQWAEEPLQPGFWGPLQRIPSNNEQNIFYHLSLIDVTQKWDRSKKGENRWKRFMGKKDTSSQQPSVYQARFMHFIRQITTFQLTEVMIRRETSMKNRLGKSLMKHIQIHEMDELKQLELEDFKKLDQRTKSDQKTKLDQIKMKKAMSTNE